MNSFEKNYQKALAAAVSKGVSCPSAKALIEAFKISADDAKKIRILCKLVDERDALSDFIANECPDTQKYVSSMYNSPYNSGMWRRTVVLHAIDRLVGGHGIEPLGPVAMSGPPYEYVNMGDTYATTLIYKKSNDRLSIGNWGDIAERHPSW